MAEQDPLTLHPNQWVKAWIKAGAPKHLHMSLVALADAIDRREGIVWKTQKAMAAEWGIAPRTFKRHLAELESRGAIEREKRHRKRGELAGTRTSDLIRFALPSARGHDGGPLSAPQGATVVTPTRGHDGGPAKFSSGVSSSDDSSLRSEVVAAHAADELQAAAEGGAGTCGFCDTVRGHDEWCGARYGRCAGCGAVDVGVVAMSWNEGRPFCKACYGPAFAQFNRECRQAA